MNILDHRILIPTSQETVWGYISNIADNPTWQADCNNISFISTSHAGVGVRWRYETTTGRAYVAETTAWYDKLGYEYTFVDGTPFRESKGRIRLQEIAEGTIVQWTFSYEMGGLLGGVRNAVTTKRQIEGTMIESLRSLWSAIQKSNKNAKPYENKSLMRDGLDAEARSNYKPRHPSNKPETPPQPKVVSPEPVIIEPPISEEDTRPRAPTKLVTSVNEPVFLSAMPDAVEDKADILPTAPEPLASPTPSVEDKGDSEQYKPVPDQLAPTEEDEIILPEREETAREVLEISVPSVLKVDTQEALSFTTTTTSSEPPPSTEELAEYDTAEVSVFDVFGIPRPSQTQEMEAVNLRSQRLTDTVPMPVEVMMPLRSGLRLSLRRRRVKLRRPI